MILIKVYQPHIPSEFEMLVVKYVVIGMLLALIFLLAFLLYDRSKSLKWKKGIFPAELKFENDNLLKAYVCLSANMMCRDLRDNGLKSSYVLSYFRKEFPNSKFDFKRHLNFSLRYPIQINTVCDWLLLNLKEETFRLQIVYFLAGVSMVDGSMNRNEFWMLQELVRQLELNPKDLDSIIAMYESNKSKRKAFQAKSNSRNNPTKRILCLQILGLTSSANFEEIKKAYRKLAMINHPDKFENQGEDQLHLAKEKFLKIQEAFSYLEKTFKSR
jgi:DnaJ like chaperone protein